MSVRKRATVSLTRRALRDIDAIAEYSASEWGHATSERYLEKLAAGLERIATHPGLLRHEPTLHESLQFYHVQSHLVVCHVELPSIVVAEIVHANMDISSRLARLSTDLIAEIEALHRRVREFRADT